MKTFAALYKKELKSIRSLALIIVSFIIFMFVLEFITHFIPFEYQPRSKIGYLHSYCRYYEYYFWGASIYMLPVIFLFSLIMERKTGTRYQMLTLPIHSSQVILAKFMAVVSIGILISFLNTFWRADSIHTLHQWLYGLYAYVGSIRYKVPVDFNYLVYSWKKISVWKPMLGGILQIGLFCSLVCIAHGVMVAFKRYRITIWALTFIGTLSLYIFLGRMIYGEFYGTPYRFIYTICAGLIFLTAGMKLIDKYGEV